MEFDNFISVDFPSVSQNEGFARIAAASFVSQLDPKVSEVCDIKTAVSEAVTNAIIHGYEDRNGTVTLFCGFLGREVYIEVIDKGKGIENIEKAREPLYTSKPELERSGMGFSVMEAFMDRVDVISKLGEGTKVIMTKKLSSEEE